MSPWIEGLRLGFKHGNHEQGQYQGCEYALHTPERREWLLGFGRGCELHKQANQLLIDAIEQHQS